MKIKITKIEKPVPITVLHLVGTLDGANSENLVDKAYTLFEFRCSRPHFGLE